MTAANGLDNEQRHSHMQTGILDDHRDNQAAQEHHRGIVHVAEAGVVGGHDAHQWVQHHRDQTRDG